MVHRKAVTPGLHVVETRRAMERVQGLGLDTGICRVDGPTPGWVGEQGSRFWTWFKLRQSVTGYRITVVKSQGLGERSHVEKECT